MHNSLIKQISRRIKYAVCVLSHPTTISFFLELMIAPLQLKASAIFTKTVPGHYHFLDHI